MLIQELGGDNHVAKLFQKPFVVAARQSCVQSGLERSVSARVRAVENEGSYRARLIEFPDQLALGCTEI